MTPGAAAAAPAPERAADADPIDPIARELQLVCARARLLLYRQIAWSEARAAAADRWEDPWQDQADRAAWSSADERGRELAASLAAVEGAVAQGRSRLRLCEATFSLDARESALLQLCLATAIAPDLAGAWSAASSRAVPTDAAAVALLGHPGARIMTPESPLSRWELVHRVPLGPGEPDALVVDPALHDWFAGSYAIDAVLIGCACPVGAVVPLAGWPVGPLGDAIAGRWERAELPAAVRVTVTAPEGAGRRSFAAAVAARLGLALLAVDADAIDEAAWPLVFRRAHRHAFLTRTALAFTGEALARRAWPDVASSFPLVFACVEPGVVPPPSRTSELTTELPSPTTDDRIALWRGAIPAAAAWPAGALDELAARNRTTPADIAAAALRGAIDPADAAEVVRERARGRLGDLAHRLECPFGWDDLVAPAAAQGALHDFAYEARERARVWEDPALRRLFPQGRGLIALFTGPPGTGKTMAAQVIAAELGLDLFRVSLAAVVSKYVGETAKNLQRILARAEHMDAVLFFDEADALFSKRTELRDAHDRYANTDTNHLLQAIESYGGVAILASNKKANIDSAFLRRLRYAVELPAPDARDRLELWRRALAGVCGADALARLAGGLPALAEAVEVTGAQIKLAALAGLFSSRREGVPLEARHVLLGVDRELAKEGRSLSERDRERLVARVR